ncbi:bifunctional glutamate--cysteine ligase GshA/glutathione synthetase GshB [Erysipelothrix sp. HDW6C]|uniref:bifunctional glutamate--cysteine ligase GshA/glutathione synthetase GshB n=1 Tax=Erysipelothrix sp. HDW6C TaxID=2714930 RepID=UPI00140BB1A7|nr:bifunctional glutamate--cysteine ligase GshA/glutathione synthetase GshB [Erysipelothrix sp. HDW6C]QIK69445.1 bifunctional glutamate--cysteine ligase GshA/glutathione synthetase GshB [Erysipelothrix sp. HDW6C]
MSQYNLFKGMFGIEKENIRVTNDGVISQSQHPSVFGEHNPYIMRDFSEAQLEMVTPPVKSITEAYQFLGNIQDIVLRTLESEYLWPQSNPPILPNEAAIPIAEYRDTNKKEYRDYLSKKYGNKRSVISGIHFNVSFDDTVLRKLWKQTHEVDFEDFKDSLYLKVAKYFQYYRWFFIHVMAASPVFHDSFVEKCVQTSQHNKQGDCSYEGLASLRNSVCGYRNDALLLLDYNSFEGYKNSIESHIAQGSLSGASELYEAVRLKSKNNNHITYLELRFIDINPLFSIGVNQSDLELIHMFMVYFAMQPDFDFNDKLQEIAAVNHDIASRNFADDEIIDSNQALQTITDASLQLLRSLEEYVNLIENVPYDSNTVLTQTRLRIETSTMSYSSQIRSEIASQDYISFHMDMARNYTQESLDNPTRFYGYEMLELSTRIVLQAAIRKGYHFEIMDADANFIRIKDGNANAWEYIKEATKTRLDPYSSVLVMENKAVTKRVLDEDGIPVPQGFVVANKREGLQLYREGLLPSALVVKPNNTNFGVGITIFPHTYTELQFQTALDHAFEADSTVLLESFISGEEYRILIIGGKVEGILYRRPASVEGDGIHTIKELVEIKNRNPLRGYHYTKPLEKIQIDNVVIDFLRQNDANVDTVPLQGERIFLRENSNISTGGDSIDVTDNVHRSYFRIAEQAARALDVSITGVDMMIANISEPANDTNHAIIEMNFNPAIHIHCFPYKGKNRNIGDTILNVLTK